MHSLGTRTTLALALTALVAALVAPASAAPPTAPSAVEARVRYQEPLPPAGPTAPALARADAPLPAALRDTFTLDSRPGSDHTLYLQFTGTTLRGTSFNTDFGLDTIVVKPFSVTPPVDTAFSAVELAEIQRAWQVTAEDYAPFDLNVTTRPPSVDALTRTDAKDPTYGATVLVTQGGPLQAACRCGGVAYGGVFSAVTAAGTAGLPAVVFGTFSGEGAGELASHESGHLFGLGHDGTAKSPYYEGRSPWAPIMGSGFDQPVTQWSAGEYAGATNLQNDVAVIAGKVGMRPDDVGDTPATVTPLTLGRTFAGLISTRTDVDAFTFTASGAVSVSAIPTASKPDLDLGLRIVDAAGTTVAVVDDPTQRASRTRVQGASASWSARLPRTPATYTVLVDGVGTGLSTPGTATSDYGSLGAYWITVKGS